MSTVQEIETAISRLPIVDQRQIQDWLDDALEDNLAFTGEFQARIARSEKEMTSGARPRVRQP